MPTDPTPNAFQTVAARGQAAFELRGSEFIGYVAPVDTVSEAEAFIEELGTANADATHNVPAYRVRTDDGRGGLLREWSSADRTGSSPSRSPTTTRGTVRGLLEADGGDFEAGHEEMVTFEVRVSVDEAEALLDRIRSATGGQATIEGA